MTMSVKGMLTLMVSDMPSVTRNFPTRFVLDSSITFAAPTAQSLIPADASNRATSRHAAPLQHSQRNNRTFLLIWLYLSCSASPTSGYHSELGRSDDPFLERHPLFSVRHRRFLAPVLSLPYRK